MPVPYVPGDRVVQLNFQGQFEGFPVENTLYFRRSTAVDLTAMETLANTLSDYWLSNAQAILPSVFEAIQVYATDLTTNTAPTYTATNGLPFNGSNTVEPMTRATTLSVSFRTAGRGRTSRGRNYWPGFCTDQVVNSVVDNGIANLIVDYYSGLIGNVSVPAGWTWGVFSRRENKEWRTVGLFQPITSVLVPTRTVATQRGRLT